jgi:hypothetical protein
MVDRRLTNATTTKRSTGVPTKLIKTAGMFALRSLTTLGALGEGVELNTGEACLSRPRYWLGRSDSRPHRRRSKTPPQKRPQGFCRRGGQCWKCNPSDALGGVCGYPPMTPTIRDVRPHRRATLPWRRHCQARWPFRTSPLPAPARCPPTRSPRSTWRRSRRRPPHARGGGARRRSRR